MTMPTFTIKQYDTSPLLRAYLLDDAQLPIDLDGAVVRFQMRNEIGELVINSEAYIEDVETGEVVYEWQQGDTDAPGVYRSEWKVEHGTGAIERFPNNTYLTVYVVQNVKHGELDE